MSYQSKFLPVLALAAALAPFAASARSGQVNGNTPAHQQYLVSVFGDQQAAANQHGRASESNVPAGLVVLDAAPQFAAASSQPSNEN